MNQVLVGVDIGGTAIKMALLRRDGAMLGKTMEATPVADGEDGIVQKVAEMMDLLLDGQGLQRGDAAGIGVGVPGTVDAQNGIVREAVNLNWKSPVHLRDKLAAATGLPVAVENDANTATLGERWQGAGQGARDMVMITLGTGVGGGIICNGQIVEGVNGIAGEIGHISMAPEGGPLCNCGKTGCLETYASATAFIRAGCEAAASGVSPALAELLANKVDIKARDVLEAAKAGDPGAAAIVEQAGLYLGLALSHLAILLNPSRLIIGGGVAAAGEFLLAKVRQSFRHFVPFPYVIASTEILPATLGNDAGMIGAAWLILSQTQHEPGDAEARLD
ncbi:ROK family glucokinase [Brevibacillus ruminantium]|uniref:Glucokinase n=1 Tax=Brevibacillus ruminantium TaxID=2950604 RepID=A0ABY4WH30_9BACL|nr:ROK family glucokinase [Brevibacillus ruminantium]USG66465.1 ROK family glucokinase [Brevibacillus ruminantium]